MTLNYYDTLDFPQVKWKIINLYLAFKIFQINEILILPQIIKKSYLQNTVCQIKLWIIFFINNFY